MPNVQLQFINIFVVKKNLYWIYLLRDKYLIIITNVGSWRSDSDNIFYPWSHVFVFPKSRNNDVGFEHDIYFIYYFYLVIIFA